LAKSLIGASLVKIINVFIPFQYTPIFIPFQYTPIFIPFQYTPIFINIYTVKKEGIRKKNEHSLMLAKNRKLWITPNAT